MILGSISLIEFFSFIYSRATFLWAIGSATRFARGNAGERCTALRNLAALVE